MPDRDPTPHADPADDASPSRDSGSDVETRPRRRTWLRLLLVPLAFYLLYLAAAEIFVETRWSEDLVNRRPERFRMEWRSGSSWLPGTFWIEAPRLRGRAPKGRWEVRGDRAMVRIDLFSLLRREVELTSVHIEGANGAWLSDAADPADGELPVIEGFPGPYPPPRPRKPGKTPWTLRFDDLGADIRTLWFDHQQIEAAPGAPGRLDMGLVIEFRTQATISFLELAMDGAVAHSDDGGRGEIERLRLSGSIAPFRPREDNLPGLLSKVDAHLELLADGWEVGAASYYLRGAPIDLGGVGRIETDARIEAGVLQPGGFFALSGDALGFDYLGHRGTGEGRLRLDVVGEAAEPRADLVFDLRAFRAGRGDADRPLVVGEGLLLEASSPSVDLSQGDPEIRAELRVESALVPAFAAFDRYVPDGAPITLVGGSGRLSARLAVDTVLDQAEGKIEIRGEAVRARFDGLAEQGETPEEIEGNVRLEIDLADGDVEQLEFRIDSADLVLDQVKTAKSTDWWTRVEVAGGQIRFAQPPAGGSKDGEALAGIELEAEVTAAMADARPFLVLLADQNRAVRWLERLVGHGRVDARGRVTADGRDLRLLDLDLEAGRHWHAEGNMRLANDSFGGVVLVEYGKLAVAIEVDRSQLETWKILRPRQHYRQWTAHWQSTLPAAR